MSERVKAVSLGDENVMLNGEAVTASAGRDARHTPSVPVVASGTAGHPLQFNVVDIVAPGVANPHNVVSGTSLCNTIELPMVFDKEKEAAEIHSIGATAAENIRYVNN